MNISRRTALAAIAIAATTFGGLNSAQAKDKLAGVRAAEAAWYAALMNADGPKLKSILSEDFAYQHPSGNTYSKKEVVETFASKRITVSKLGDVNLKFRDYGSTVVAYGSNPIEGMLDGKPYQGNIRFVDVWRQVNGRWVMVHRNSQILNP
jgi:ketosteroid isomerase-like protein